MLRLNQSTIKKVNNIFCCPAKYKAYNIDELFKGRTTDSMLKGQFFEYMALGSRTREGKIPFMPKLKNGNKSSAQIRIEKQVEVFHKLLRETGTRIVKPNVTQEAHYVLPNGSTIILFGTMDILVERMGKPGIIDLKLTMNVDSDFGDFCWGDISKMNILQPNCYKYIAKQNTGVNHWFEYWVFDYKPKYSHKIIPIETTWDDVTDMANQIQQSVRKLDVFKAQGYPAVGSHDECKECSVKNCSERIAENGLKRKKEKVVGNKKISVGKKETILMDFSNSVDPFL